MNIRDLSIITISKYYPNRVKNLKLHVKSMSPFNHIIVNQGYTIRLKNSLLKLNPNLKFVDNTRAEPAWLDKCSDPAKALYRIKSNRELAFEIGSKLPTKYVAFADDDIKFSGQFDLMKYNGQAAFIWDGCGKPYGIDYDTDVIYFNTIQLMIKSELLKPFFGVYKSIRDYPDDMVFYTLIRKFGYKFDGIRSNTFKTISEGLSTWSRVPGDPANELKDRIKYHKNYISLFEGEYRGKEVYGFRLK